MRLIGVTLLLVAASCRSDPDRQDTLEVEKFSLHPASLTDGTLDGAKTWPHAGPYHGDSDCDGLTEAEEAIVGTSDENADTDGDGLLDGWEVKGVDGVRLQDDLFGDGAANPLRKDVYVEMDYMERSDGDRSLAGNDAVYEKLRGIFRKLPVKNPDGEPGISLHLHEDSKVPHSQLVDATDFLLLKLQHFPKERWRTFHYMIWIDQWKEDAANLDWSGRSMAIPDSDFAVSLGLWNNGAGGSDAQKIGTFMHELGHNLGLRHGGAPDDNERRKSNHFSVMNYFWQMGGLRDLDGQAGHYVYQWLEVDPIDETALDENAPIHDEVAFETAWYNPSGFSEDDPEHSIVRAAANAPINWNAQPPHDEKDLEIDLNHENGTSGQGRTVNEYLMLDFTGGLVSSDADFLEMRRGTQEKFRRLLGLDDEQRDAARELTKKLSDFLERGLSGPREPR